MFTCYENFKYGDFRSNNARLKAKFLDKFQSGLSLTIHQLSFEKSFYKMCLKIFFQNFLFQTKFDFVRGTPSKRLLKTSSSKKLVSSGKNIGTKIHVSETHFFHWWQIFQKNFISSLQTKVTVFESSRIFILLPYVVNHGFLLKFQIGKPCTKIYYF